MAHEITAWADQTVVAGIDEAGRGCLAGPVVAAALILHPHATHPLIRDSKTLSPEERKTCAVWLKNNSWYGIGIVSPACIDKINIWRATQWAMHRALAQLYCVTPQEPRIILIDAMPLKLPVEYPPVIHAPFGESWSISIAAASIIAKTTRDALMENFDTIIPGFNFNIHKGYGTPQHKKNLALKSLTIIHRQSYISTETAGQKLTQTGLFNP